MKPWISIASHLFASVTSFVTLSVAPVVAYGAVALTRSWQSGVEGDASSILAVPVLSALGAGLFSVAVAPALSSVARKVTQRFGWSVAMFPLMLACGATVALSAANSLLGWQWSSGLVVGGGIAFGAAFSAYWLPLCWMQKVLPRLDARGNQLRGRFEPRHKPVRVPLS